MRCCWPPRSIPKRTVSGTSQDRRGRSASTCPAAACICPRRVIDPSSKTALSLFCAINCARRSSIHSCALPFALHHLRLTWPSARPRLSTPPIWVSVSMKRIPNSLGVALGYFAVEIVRVVRLTCEGSSRRHQSGSCGACSPGSSSPRPRRASDLKAHHRVVTDLQRLGATLCGKM